MNTYKNPIKKRKLTHEEESCLNLARIATTEHVSLAKAKQIVQEFIYPNGIMDDVCNRMKLKATNKKRKHLIRNSERFYIELDTDGNRIPQSIKWPIAHFQSKNFVTCNWSCSFRKNEYGNFPDYYLFEIEGYYYDSYQRIKNTQTGFPNTKPKMEEVQLPREIKLVPIEERIKLINEYRPYYKKKLHNAIN